MNPALSFYQTALATHEHAPLVTRLVHPRKVGEAPPGHVELMNESYTSGMYHPPPVSRPSLLRRQDFGATHFDYFHDPNTFRKNQMLAKARFYDEQGQAAEVRMAQYLHQARQQAVAGTQAELARQVQFKAMLREQEQLEKQEERQKIDFMTNYFRDLDYAQRLKKLSDQRHLRDVYYQQVRFNKLQQLNERFPALDETYSQFARSCFR